MWKVCDVQKMDERMPSDGKNSYCIWPDELKMTSMERKS